MNTNLQQSLSKIDSLLKNSKYSSLLTQKAKDSATTITTTAAATTATTVAPEEQKQSLPLPNSQPTHSIRATALHPQATAEAKLPLESAVTTYNYFPVDNPLDSNLPIQTSVSIPSQKIQKSAKDGKKGQNKKQKKTDNQKSQKDSKTLRKAAGEIWEDTSLQDWPENDFRIFCGNLGNEVTDEMLASSFRKYSSFSRARVIRDKKTSKTKGFGFVSLLEANDYIQAMKEMNGKYVGNRPVKLSRSSWKDRSLDSSTSEVQEVQFKKVKKK